VVVEQFQVADAGVVVVRQAQSGRKASFPRVFARRGQQTLSVTTSMPFERIAHPGQPQRT
jgi:Holliday junction resolvase